MEQKDIIFTFATSLKEIEKKINKTESILLLAPIQSVVDAEKNLGNKLAAAWPLIGMETKEELQYALKALIQESKLHHDLVAAESVAWHGTFTEEDSNIEFLGATVLEISTCRDMAAVEQALFQACSRITKIENLRIILAPNFLPIEEMSLYRLAIPVQSLRELQAHVYVQFPLPTAPEIIEQVGGALLNLGDAISLAIERNQILYKAEQTKAVWEASFDAVDDPVAILDDNFLVIRANLAFGKLVHIPISDIQGNECLAVGRETLKENIRIQKQEWDLIYQGKNYRVFFDPIDDPQSSGRYVLRLHDVTKERALTEKILAREQIAEMGILAGSVAHEINNPVGGIIAFAQILLKENSLSANLRNDIEEILKAAERCRRIVQTMLLLVRKAEEDKKIINILECIQLAKDIIEAEAKRLNIKIIFPLMVEDGSMNFLANKNQMVQVFFHLLQQSLHALAERKNNDKFSAIIQIQAINKDSKLFISIEDNGATEIHVYDVDSSVAFAVSQMMVEEHGGSISLECCENKNIQKIIFPLPSTF